MDDGFAVVGLDVGFLVGDFVTGFFVGYLVVGGDPPPPNNRPDGEVGFCVGACIMISEEANNDVVRGR